MGPALGGGGGGQECLVAKHVVEFPQVLASNSIIVIASHSVGDLLKKACSVFHSTTLIRCSV